jgi:hypothetical protein
MMAQKQPLSIDLAALVGRLDELESTMMALTARTAKLEAEKKRLPMALSGGDEGRRDALRESMGSVGSEGDQEARYLSALVRVCESDAEN